MSRIIRWLRSILSIFIRPTVSNFRSITHSVEDCFGEAIAWIAIIVILYFAPASIIYDDIELFNALVVCIVMIPIWFLLFVFSIHKMNQILFKEKKNTYNELLYSNAIIFILTSLILKLKSSAIPATVSLVGFFL